MNRIRWALSAWLGLLLLSGCGRSEGATTPSAEIAPTLLPTPTLADAVVLPTATLAGFETDTGWQTLALGRETRTLTLLSEQGLIVEEVSILRLDLATHELRVAYQLGEPLPLATWLADSGAVAVANGGYFTPDFFATGLVVVDGQSFGSSYGDFAGMLAVSDTTTELAWLAERPSLPSEPLRYGLQSFPMLIKPGGVADYPDDGSDPSRRTVIAQDSQGRMLLMVANWGHFSLHALSQFLAETDLDLDVALNLDGGTSSGLITAETGIDVPGYVPVPAVILVFPRP